MPPLYDVLWGIVLVPQVSLLASALTLWFQRCSDRGGGLLDLVVIIVLPVIGPAAYLAGRALSRNAARPAGGESGSA